jgi:hypothetical protein
MKTSPGPKAPQARIALCHHLAGAIEKRAGIVAARLQKRRIGGLRQHHPHLLGDGIERIAHHREGRGVERRPAGPGI